MIDKLRKHPEALFLAGLGATLAIGSTVAVIAAAQPDGVPAFVRAVQGGQASVPEKTLAQSFLTERVLGAGDGMRDAGWSNAELEARLAVLAATQPDELRDALNGAYQSGYDEGVAGKWSEIALDGYITAAEATRGEMNELYVDARAAGGDAYMNAGLAAARAGLVKGTIMTAPYIAQALEGTLLTDVAAFDILSDRVESQTSIYEGEMPVEVAARDVGALDKAPDELAMTSEAADIVRYNAEGKATVHVMQGHDRLEGRYDSSFMQSYDDHPEEVARLAELRWQNMDVSDALGWSGQSLQWMAEGKMSIDVSEEEWDIIAEEDALSSFPVDTRAEFEALQLKGQEARVALEDAAPTSKIEHSQAQVEVPVQRALSEVPLEQTRVEVPFEQESVAVEMDRERIAIEMDRERIPVTLEQERVPVEMEQKRIPITFDTSKVHPNLVESIEDPFEIVPLVEADAESDLDR